MEIGLFTKNLVSLAKMADEQSQIIIQRTGNDCREQAALSKEAANLHHRVNSVAQRQFVDSAQTP